MSEAVLPKKIFVAITSLESGDRLDAFAELAQVPSSAIVVGDYRLAGQGRMERTLVPLRKTRQPRAPKVVQASIAEMERGDVPKPKRIRRRKGA